MTNPNDRITRDAIRKSRKVVIRFGKDETRVAMTVEDPEFINDIANAFARHCDREERKRT